MSSSEIVVFVVGVVVIGVIVVLSAFEAVKRSEYITCTEYADTIEELNECKRIKEGKK